MPFLTILAQSGTQSHVGFELKSPIPMTVTLNTSL